MLTVTGRRDARLDSQKRSAAAVLAKMDDQQELEEDYPIFFDIDDGDLAPGLEAVQQHVRADAAVLDIQAAGEYCEPKTPLIYAVCVDQPEIALWLIEHRGQHELDTGDEFGQTALHSASKYGELEVVEALVVADADPAALTGGSCTPPMAASYHGQTDVAAFLLQLPAVMARPHQQKH